MGLKTLDSPAIGGGVSIFVCSLYSKGASVLPAFILSGCQFSDNRGKFSVKQAKVRFYLLALVFSRENRRPKTAKFKIYLIFEGCRASVVALLACRLACPLGAGGQGAGLVLSSCGVFRPFLPAFCPLCCFACGGLLANMPLFRNLRAFLARFGVRMYICMG